MFPRPKRAREIISAQGLMPNSTSLPYPIPSLFASQKLFVGFSPKGLSDCEAPSVSPTSTLETKHFSTIDKNQKKNPPIGLGLVDALHNESKSEKKPFNPDSRMVLFGSQLKIQVPSVQSNSIASPIEFGVKTKNSQLALYSPLSLDAPPAPSSFSPQALTEMELSEDYTCVISHGPNPKTTHIFDNCIVESCGGNGFVASKKDDRLSTDRPGYSSDDFLSFCYACKKNLSQGRDIFMYRGEKAFCSQECRHREMLFDEGMGKFTEDLSDVL